MAVITTLDHMPTLIKHSLATKKKKKKKQRNKTAGKGYDPYRLFLPQYSTYGKVISSMTGSVIGRGHPYSPQGHSVSH